MSELQELRESVDKVSDSIHNLRIDEKLLKRYLKAFRSVPEAYKRILATDKWRGEYGAARLTSETPSVKRTHATRLAVILEERDLKGRPVVVVAVRNHSLQNRNLADISDYIIYLLDTLCTKCQEDGLDNTCIVFDMRNFNLMCMDYQAVKALYQIMSDHYPERLGVCLILSAPYIFSACWMIIRAWMDENTASKIKFLKTEELTPYINPDIIPWDL